MSGCVFFYVNCWVMLKLTFQAMMKCDKWVTAAPLNSSVLNQRWMLFYLIPVIAAKGFKLQCLPRQIWSPHIGFIGCQIFMESNPDADSSVIPSPRRCHFLKYFSAWFDRFTHRLDLKTILVWSHFVCICKTLTHKQIRGWLKGKTDESTEERDKTGCRRALTVWSTTNVITTHTLHTHTQAQTSKCWAEYPQGSIYVHVRHIHDLFLPRVDTLSAWSASNVPLGILYMRGHTLDGDDVILYTKAQNCVAPDCEHARNIYSAEVVGVRVHLKGSAVILDVTFSWLAEYWRVFASEWEIRKHIRKESIMLSDSQGLLILVTPMTRP